ncbi:MAG TPA: serine/threonine-protein kinase [Polyangiaceae bacterium]|nr:serine/threonine-protein kinase [Polyangiaceae bacterium]
MLDPLISGMVVAGRYRLEHRLGTGTVGSLWQARDLAGERACSVRLADEGGFDLAAVRARFEAEARAATALRSENVVNVLDQGEWSGMPFLVFEALEGEDLAVRLRREGRLDPGAVHEIVCGVARALARAHELGIVHRDLKPENVFLVQTPGGEVAKVLDFGVSGDGSALNRATKCGPQVALPLYTSPEQALGKPVDFRADLWSLGAIAFHCLTGHPPFESTAQGELLARIASDEAPKLSDYLEDVPPGLEAWRENALSKDPELRFQSAEELAEALGDALARATPTGFAPPEWQAPVEEAKPSERRPSAPAPAPTPDDVEWLLGLPPRQNRPAEALSESPLSQQRDLLGAYAGTGARRRRIRVAIGAFMGMLVAVIAVAVMQRGTEADSVAAARLPRAEPAEKPVSVARPEPMPALPQPLPEVAAPASPAAAPCHIGTPGEAESEASTDTGRAPAGMHRQNAQPFRARESRRFHKLTNALGEPDYGI